MRKRSVGINVRVSVTEKRKMTLMAKRCGLSLSEYLRQRALGYEPGGHPPKEVFDVLDKLDEIAENLSLIHISSPSAAAQSAVTSSNGTTSTFVVRVMQRG